ncbi:hypothetical protein MKO06_14590 [Gramella sp. GC03-9]|uniref:Heat-shock protein Hsp90 n=1 Tax=Christiangramia oceanisediminis TaxID=2920386 RepID=A0A9X2RA39_9FLAO|nr:DUF6503 family protein [Gramella oceanisediminis]MCP9201143.1 hypothetical protein [Gramella oceanisediminis]
MKRLLSILCILVIISCKDQNTEKPMPVEPDNGIGDGAGPPPALSFSENIEEAHNKTAFMTNEAVAFNIELIFGGETRLDGEVSMLTNSTKVRLDKSNGASVIYDGDQVFITPDTASDNGARFDIFTWQYFFAMPFKLTDPGTVWDQPKKQILDSLEYDAARLSFESSIGDSPDDWYVVYQDPETSRLKAAAYIVTFSKDQDEAEKNPHAIVYSDYKMVDGVAFATKWSFHNWSQAEGLGEKLGEASISNIRFFEPGEESFRVPENSKPVNK